MTYRSPTLPLLALLLTGASCATDPTSGQPGGTGGGAGTGGATGSGGSVASCGAGTGGFTGPGGAVGAAGAGGGGGMTGTGGAAAGAGGLGGAGGPDPQFMIFLLIGQSNMEGLPRPQSQDLTQNPRIKVLAYDNCPGQGRQYNQWYTASPPLHGCGAGVGPGDYFARTLADAYPQATIGLVPCGISGVDVDFFRKNVVSARRTEFRIPPDNHWSGAYEWVLERARLAQQAGVIRGILFHQGESDNTSGQWVGKVREMVTDLRTDLALGEAPFLAGELLYTGCCSAHNRLIAQLPSQVTSSYVISACGLGGVDQAHFDLPGQRELGLRYGQQMLQALGR